MLMTDQGGANNSSDVRSGRSERLNSVEQNNEAESIAEGLPNSSPRFAIEESADGDFLNKNVGDEENSQPT